MAGMPPKDKEDGAADRSDARPGGRFAGYRGPLQSPNEALQPEAAPPPPPAPPSRRRPVVSAVSGFLSFLLIAAVASMCALIWSEQRMREPGPLAADKVLYIVPGTEVPEIIGELDREGIIDSPFALNVALLLEGNRSKVKAGEYLFKQNASLREVMDTLVSGKQILHAVTIPEGLTSEQIVERLQENDVLLGDIKDAPKEGSLLPETYKVFRGASRADLIKKMQDDQKKAVDQIWSHRNSDLPLHSPYELVTLASIVEKETGKADERPHVASVFMNRLAKRMRLQSDPTIVYGLVGGKGTLGRGITRVELEKSTPYNTYTIDGLPPGPIANPGRAALEAVANPSRTQDLYFVADGTGGHVFAETLDQHARNVQRWRQIEKDAKDKPAASDVDKAPQIAPVGPGRPDQRGEITTPGSIYGALPSSLEAPGAGSGVRPLNDGSAAPLLMASSPLGAPDIRNARADKLPAPARAFSMGPGLEELGITVRGAPAVVSLDGPENPSDMADAPDEPMNSPVAANPRADQKAHVARLGLASGGDAPQSDSLDRLPVAAAPDPPPPVAATPNGPVSHARIIDVSEGTPLDPLLDKTYDLNYAKNVPSMK
ncbi:MAG: endolytic transglycosylase MltG [Methylocella sp.]